MVALPLTGFKVLARALTADVKKGLLANLEVAQLTHLYVLTALHTKNSTYMAAPLRLHGLKVNIHSI